MVMICCCFLVMMGNAVRVVCSVMWRLICRLVFVRLIMLGTSSINVC